MFHQNYSGQYLVTHKKATPAQNNVELEKMYVFQTNTHKLSRNIEMQTVANLIPLHCIFFFFFYKMAAKTNPLKNPALHQMEHAEGI